MSIPSSTRSKLTVLALAAFAVAVAVPANATSWKVDPNHSRVGFSVKHFFTPVTGTFNEFDIQLAYDPESPADSKIEVTIPVASVDTGNERRDGHLRTADFFEAETYPTITFKSTSVRAESDGNLIATGPLTIKGISKEIELAIEVLGVQELPKQMQEMLGATRVAGFGASTSIDRGDFGVGKGDWAATVMVASDVDISIQIEASAK